MINHELDVKMKKVTVSASLGLISLMALAGCQTPGEDLKADVYSADQVNSRQAANVVSILAVMPARIKVDNTQAKQLAQVGGGFLGAVGGGFLGNRLGNGSGFGTGVGAVGGGAAGVAAGSLVSDKVLVEGVSLTYMEKGQTFNSAQVGRACEFKDGDAVVVSTSATETRIQPNSACPVVSKT